MTTLYKDLFNGTAGNFVGRSPDIGAAYTTPIGSLANVLVDGSGNQPSWLAASIEPTSACTATSAGDTTLTWKFSAGAAAYDISAVVYQQDIADGAYLITAELDFSSGTSTWYATLSVNDHTGANLYNNQVDCTSSITGSSQTLTVEITGGNTTLKIDGATILTTANIPDAGTDTISFSNTINTSATPPSFSSESIQFDVGAVATNHAELVYGGWTLEGDSGGVMRATYGGWTLADTVGGAMRGTAPAPSLFGLGRETSGNRMIGDAPGQTLDGRGGAVAILAFPMPKLTATGTLIDMGTMFGEAPAPSMIAHGTPTIMGVAKLVYGGYALLARGGAAAMMTAPAPTLLASATKVNVGVARLVAPVPFMLAHGFTTNVGTMYGLFPAPSMVQSAFMRARWGAPTLVALGHDPTDTGYEGWSITLLAGEDPMAMEVAASRYVTLPFEQIVRFGDRYYGVGLTGIFEIGGDLFDTAPIIATVQTAEWDSGTITFKRYPALFLAGRVGADFDVSLITSELETDTYNYRVVSKAGAGVHRVRMGRGINAGKGAHYAAYAFRNRNGEDFMIDNFAPQIEVLRSAV